MHGIVFFPQLSRIISNWHSTILLEGIDNNYVWSFHISDCKKSYKYFLPINIKHYLQNHPRKNPQKSTYRNPSLRERSNVAKFLVEVEISQNAFLREQAKKVSNLGVLYLWSHDG